MDISVNNNLIATDVKDGTTEKKEKFTELTLNFNDGHTEIYAIDSSSPIGISVSISEHGSIKPIKSVEDINSEVDTINDTIIDLITKVYE